MQNRWWPFSGTTLHLHRTGNVAFDEITCEIWIRPGQVYQGSLRIPVVKGIVYLSGEDLVLAEHEMLGAIRSLGGSEQIAFSDGPVRILAESPPSGLASR